MFPYDNVVVGVLILLIGFVFHWLGQTLSVLNWELATRIGLQDKNAPPEYRVYEHAIAVADTAVGWLHGVAGIGLLLDAAWGYKLAWIPGIIFVYHGISFWAWTHNQNKAGHKLYSIIFRVIWILVNIVTGLLAVMLAWNSS